MNIKTWTERLEEMEDGAITTSHHVTSARQAEIDELRAALKAQPVQEPVQSAHKLSMSMFKDKADYDEAVMERFKTGGAG